MNKIIINDVTVTLTDEQLKANGLQRIPELKPEIYEEWEPDANGELYYYIGSAGQICREKRRLEVEANYQLRRAMGNVFMTEAKGRTDVARQQAIVRIRSELRRLEFLDDGDRDYTPYATSKDALKVRLTALPSAHIKGFKSTEHAWQKVIKTHEDDVRLVLRGGGKDE